MLYHRKAYEFLTIKSCLFSFDTLIIVIQWKAFRRNHNDIVEHNNTNN